MDNALTNGISPTADVCVVLPASDRSPDSVDRFVAEASDQACASLVIPAEGVGVPMAMPTYRGSFPVHRLKPEFQVLPHFMNADELTGRIKALCDIHHPMRKMRDELTRLRRDHGRRKPANPDLDEQLRLAGQIQNDLLPEPITDTAPLAISTLYLPAEFVSGDTYDISRLDEDRFGFSIADATGHGLPAALLAIMVKNSLRGKEIVNGSYRIIEPDELLIRLNEDLLTARLRQCHFITAMHAIFDRSTSQVRWARGGTPYPILIRPDVPPRQIRSAGGLLGAFDHQSFEVVSHDMRPGDLLLFYTDGLEALLLKRHATDGDDAILRTLWMEQLRIEGPDAALQEIQRLASENSPQSWPRDDITVLAIRMN